MARLLGVSRSGYYASLKRGPSRRSTVDEKLKLYIKAVHARSRATYGSIRVQRELAHEGIRVGRDRIARLRKELRFQCVQRRKFKTTTNARHALPVVPNILNQQFGLAEPGRVWGTDLTYIPTGEGWLYLAGVKDFGSREIVGYAMDGQMKTALVQAALAKALSVRAPAPGCIHHSDRGSQYCSYEYQKDVLAAGLTPSMSGKGNCYDNAPMESFWGSLKQELVFPRRFLTRNEARAAIQEYIEVFYNRIRRHSSIGYVAPSVYADQFYLKRKSA